MTKHLRLREESGYSLVEVMVAIMIMTLAILPMMSMFDMGLHSTIEGSKYDKARMLANLKLEQAKNLPFDSLDATIQDVKDNFPENVGTVTAYDPGTGYYESGPKAQPGFPTSMTYVVEKQYMAQPSQDPAGLSENWGTCQTNGTCDPGTNLIRVTVTVQWDGNEYTTHGLVTGS
jgi:prepilin-type N-terminal cleavage/methylation domain-containing protein